MKTWHLQLWRDDEAGPWHAWVEDRAAPAERSGTLGTHAETPEPAMVELERMLGGAVLDWRPLDGAPDAFTAAAAVPDDLGLDALDLREDDRHAGASAAIARGWESAPGVAPGEDPPPGAPPTPPAPAPANHQPDPRVAARRRTLSRRRNQARRVEEIARRIHADPPPPPTDQEPPVPKPAPCRVPGCGKRRTARGLCQACYSRWVRAGKPDVEAFIAAGGEPAAAAPRPIPGGPPGPVGHAAGGGPAAAARDLAGGPASAPGPRSTPAEAPPPVEHAGPLRRLDSGFLELVALPAGTHALAIGYVGDYLTLTTEQGRVIKQLRLPEAPR